jgi:hypothetical protein
MNFQELYNKIKALDEGTGVMAAPSSPQIPTDGNAQLECGDMPGKPNLPGDDELLTTECGDDMGPDHAMSAPKQSDSVTMNVSMNGSGSGGIKDLMNILKNIEQGASRGEPAGDVVLGMDEEQADGEFQSATTKPQEQEYDLDIMTRTGNDIHSKGKEAPKMNGGGNPMQEALIRKLSDHYAQVKAR